MSEENLNNNEETAALFVAKQKQKEADKKAAEEQAEINLKAAEAARMEAEIAERKKKAVQRKIMAVVIAVVAVIVTFFVIINLGSKVHDIGKYDYSSLQFDSEFTPDSSDHKVTIRYPGAFYTSVSENKFGETGRIVEFTPEKPEDVTTKVSLFYMTVDKAKAEINRIPFVSPVFMMENIKKTTKENIIDMVNGAAISDLEEADPTAENPGRYFYSCTFTSAENSGEAASWYELSEDGFMQIVTVYSMAPGEDPADGKTVCDAFVANNADNAHLIVGMNPPSGDAALDGYIEYPDIDLKLKVPKDTFYPHKNDNYMTFGDSNGAAIMILPNHVEGGFGNFSTDSEQFLQNCMETSKTRLPSILQGVSNHEQFSPEYISETGYDFSITYTFEQNGIKYMELYVVAPFSDTVHGNDYFVELEIFYPYSNMNEYTSLFSETISAFLGVE